ncbi:DUF2157 domain-containing protein [Candidatus Sulfurimonas marisnigri]|uniref:DUF2157 domain-containing protein n=1 Tax=Candidatus Sulfurimonas marisnigri TaxID=2740405 RepID=A0A7S7RRK2_9BACT|nr:DUF2157 domain-containing protein [Candidatus Sulfurimonas marisnigri]QOY55768.1 DUF2157 domain-containing protein [Candidatus Sulfurimonas marisnigri]
MQNKSSLTAQQRTDQIKSFQAELEVLKDADIISLTDKQDEKISQYHQKLLSNYYLKFDTETTKNEKQISLGMKIASFLAALGLAFSIFFLFMQFWGDFVETTQVMILILTPTVFFFLTAYLSKQQSRDYYTKISGLLTFVTFILNLSMLGQIFNISESPNAFFVWSLFAFLLAYALNARLLLGVGIIFFSFFLSVKVGVLGGAYWINFSDNPENFFPIALILFLLSFINHSKYSNFDVIYRYFSMFLFFLPVLVLSNYGVISYINMDKNFIEGFYQLLGFGFSAFAIYIGIKKGLAEVTNMGNVFFVIFLYTKFYNWWWAWMPKYIFFLVIGLSAVFILIVLKRFREKLLSNTQGKVS